ncbi:MAG: GTPase [Gemmataceae bacterium]
MKSSTYLARLTPPGIGAIATLALRGPGALEVLRKTFRRAQQSPSSRDFFTFLESRAEPGAFWFGKFGDLTSATDEVVLSLRRTTPTPWFEIHCHGGRHVVAMLEEVLQRHGVQVCSWQELYRLTTADEWKVVALEAMTMATTVRTATILLDQFHGAFVGAVSKILELLQNRQWETAKNELSKLRSWASLGRHLTTPWRVVIGGAPNVGKSSLINRLAGYQRSVVAPAPGTTRDVVSTSLAIDGWPIEVIDTAGLRTSPEALEKAGIDLATEALQTADLALWVVDGSNDPVWPTEEFGQKLVVINKVDLDPVWDFSNRSDAILVSAKTGKGIDKLCETISHWLVPEPPEPGTAVPFTDELCSVIETAAKLWDSNPESARDVLEEWKS